MENYLFLIRMSKEIIEVLSYDQIINVIFTAPSHLHQYKYGNRCSSEYGKEISFSMGNKLTTYCSNLKEDQSIAAGNQSVAFVRSAPYGQVNPEVIKNGKK